MRDPAFELTLLGGQLTRQVLAASSGFSLREYQILTAVHMGIQTSTKMAEMFGVTPLGINKIAQRLENTGYLKYHIGPNDGRGRYYTLTENGEAILEEFSSQFNNLLTERINSMTHPAKAAIAMDNAIVLLRALL